MISIKLSDIEEALKTLNYKSPIIDISDGYITIDIGTGWLITNEKKINEKVLSKIHH